MPRLDQTTARTLTSCRDCPVCAEPVHWSRYWLRSWAWAKWPCPRCGSLLGFDKKRRGVMAVQFLVVMLLFSCLQSQYAPIVAVPIALTAAVAWGLLDRVVVIDRRNPRYCRSCRYDLSGTLGAGITKCPECGTPATIPP